MARSLWKGPFIQNLILKKATNWKKNNLPSYKLIRIWSRNSVIFPSFVGLNFEVYNGKTYVPLLIKKKMIGAKFGEFVLTRKMVKHK
ncbi:ribosomal protein S19 (mitochondrion) [Hemiselmis andersenii]|uniref:Small ribosomal subunit protein uS19c n=1 Tax=Hemiselmis andersenii TaxID=464988 RepID=B2MWV6_HEMAN|nr:ribosomal protein S19 [Hemiselmis andersenii]ACC78248.1 ribosomal protein S19 [Hemiselmis andersenii]|mmetsp:Transcript_41949/g.102368  ORF Transcript_41949/g.102368 Transcript_41949/m.102368 type:complete len:87 (-) Transcript_41949:14-274(-)